MPKEKSSPPAAASEDAIRTIAYLMWEADGRPEGGAEHYWGLAAAELARGGKAGPEQTAAANPPESTRAKSTKATKDVTGKAARQPPGKAKKAKG